MADPIGSNTVNSEKLRSFVERCERLDEEKKDIGLDRKAVIQEAEREGFKGKLINHLIKRRKMKPHDREDIDAQYEMYEHALGMASEPPVFRQIRALATDDMSLAKLVEAWSKMIAPGNDVIVRIGGKATRIWKDKEGNTHHGDYTPPTAHEPSEKRNTLPPRDTTEIPDCDEAGAVELGKQAYRDNVPIIKNPFPYNDKRRPKWDEGWRLESVGDGMGPNEKK